MLHRVTPLAEKYDEKTLDRVRQIQAALDQNNIWEVNRLIRTAADCSDVPASPEWLEKERKVIASLSVTQRTCLKLRLQGLKPQAIAQRMGMSIEAVRRSLAAAYTEIRGD